MLYNRGGADSVGPVDRVTKVWANNARMPEFNPEEGRRNPVLDGESLAEHTSGRHSTEARVTLSQVAHTKVDCARMARDQRLEKRQDGKVETYAVTLEITRICAASC